MKIVFSCRRCRAQVTGDPARPLKCAKCGESYAGDTTYVGAIGAVTQCAICRGSQIIDQTWSQRFMGPGLFFVFFLMIIPSRGLSLLLPFGLKFILDRVLPRHRLCRECGGLYYER